jgi:hypothetical protein
MRTPYIVGPPVRAAGDFFGRSQQAQQFFESMAGQQVQCVSVLGLRRAGKTSFLQYVAHPEMAAAHLPDPERYVLVYIDMSACKTPADFYTRVHRRLTSRLMSLNSNGQTMPQPATDVYGIESLLYEFKDYRVIILMDEFDQLRIASFGQEFMTELRGLASVWDYELAFVTASYWDLYRLGNFIGLPLTSPFYNIFYPQPIYLSGLNASEMEDLVRTPARRVGIAADDEDIAFIRRIGGSLPFFVQATAAVWFPHKALERLPDAHDITQRLVSEMSPYFDQWWRNFSDVERDVLIQVVFEKPIERLPYGEYEVDEAVNHLINYGLISVTGNNVWPDSAIFCHWLREYIGRTPASARIRAS